MKEKIAVVPGAFNPPTVGHLKLIESLNLYDRVLLVPIQSYARGEHLTPYETRIDMLQAFLKDVPTQNASVYAVEHYIHPDGTYVKTSQVIEYIESENPSADVTLVVKPEHIAKFSTSSDTSHLVGRISLLVNTELTNISSSIVREKKFRDIDISDDITPSVHQLIHAKNLYEDLADTL